MSLQLREPCQALLLQQVLAVVLIEAAMGDKELALLPGCKLLKAPMVLHRSESSCFCYIPNEVMYLKNTWSTIQVSVNSTEMFEVVPIPEEHNCQSAEYLSDFLKCLISNIWQPSASNQTIMSVDKYVGKTCFRIQSANKILYTVSVEQNILDKSLFRLFVAGGLLFHFAYNLSRSNTFYCCAGITLGVLTPLVFLLLMLKRYIPKLSTFWILISGCWFLSLYVFYTSKEKLKWIWFNSTFYVLGYILTVGFICFVICKKQGPFRSEQSRNLLMWMLQLKGLILVYFGIAIPQVAYAVIMAMLCAKFLLYPLRAFSYVGRKAVRFFRPEKLEIRYLTEDEYQEQGETETIKALEELRTFCRDPSFPSWVAVVKLQSPQKFANFVLGFPHVSPEEQLNHEAQYGIGGAFLEQQFFSAGIEAEPEPHPASTELEENNEAGEQNALPFHSL